MREKVCDRAKALEWVKAVRDCGGIVVFTNGCFDLLHAGHVRYLEAARALGDFLIVGLNSDKSVASIKGPGRPVVTEGHRAEVLAGLECVNAVTLFDEDTPLALIRELMPDVLAKGADWAEDAIAGADVVKAAGGRVARIPLEPGASTTGIIRAILERFGQGGS